MHRPAVTSMMKMDFRGIEPFPVFTNSSPLPSPNIVLNTNGFQFLRSTRDQQRKPRVSISQKMTNYLLLRYYQYEVTFGLYMMTRTEKFVLNTILALIFSAIICGLFFGLEPFVVHNVCRLIYYITGSFSSAPVTCEPWR